jgi:hypothetical protein
LCNTIGIVAPASVPMQSFGISQPNGSVNVSPLINPLYPKCVGGASLISAIQDSSTLAAPAGLFTFATLPTNTNQTTLAAAAVSVNTATLVYDLTLSGTYTLTMQYTVGNVNSTMTFQVLLLDPCQFATLTLNPPWDYCNNPFVLDTTKPATPVIFNLTFPASLSFCKFNLDLSSYAPFFSGAMFFTNLTNADMPIMLTANTNIYNQSWISPVPHIIHTFTIYKGNVVESIA